MLSFPNELVNSLKFANRYYEHAPMIEFNKFKVRQHKLRVKSAFFPHGQVRVSQTLALARLETRVSLVDYVNSTFATHNAAVLITRFGRFK